MELAKKPQPNALESCYRDIVFPESTESEYESLPEFEVRSVWTSRVLGRDPVPALPMGPAIHPASQRGNHLSQAPATGGFQPVKLSEIGRAHV